MFTTHEPNLAKPEASVELRESAVGGVVWMIAGIALYFFAERTFGTLLFILGFLSVFVSRAVLILDKQGFEYKNILGSTRYDWSQIGSFFKTTAQAPAGSSPPVQLPWTSIVGFSVLVPSTRALKESVFALVFGTNNKIAGLFGVPADELVAAMEARRAHAGAKSSPAQSDYQRHVAGMLPSFAGPALGKTPPRQSKWTQSSDEIFASPAYQAPQPPQPKNTKPLRERFTLPWANRPKKQWPYY